MEQPVTFPGGRQFAFTVFDDTDHATVENTRPVYDLLAELGLRTTKSVWVYPPRGRFTGGSLLHDDRYCDYIRQLSAAGFEIGLHNIGDGAFSREEILAGFEAFREKLGFYPTIHVNHVSNPDNIYWWDRRFEWPISAVYRRIARDKIGAGGEVPGERFWGDLAKRHIRYIRNLTFNDINTLKCDPRMPYRVEHKSQWSNAWFSSSDGHTVTEFTALLHPSNVDRLVAERGACIVYTHFASGFVTDGAVHPEFARRLRYLASQGGCFVPVGTLLDHLAGKGTQDPGYAYRLGLNIRWALQRLQKRRRFGR